MKILAVCALLVVACVACSNDPSSDGSAASPSSNAETPPSDQKTFTHEGIELQYPADWSLAVALEGAGVSNGCSEGFWAARTEIPGGGIAGVGRCPSSFDWPPEGETIPEALRRELAMKSPEDVVSIRALDASEMQGAEGIWIATSLDAAAAKNFGISGPSDGVIIRAAVPSEDPMRPDIYEVFCQVPAADANIGLNGCELMAETFQLTPSLSSPIKAASVDCNPSEVQLGEILVENGNAIVALAENQTPGGYKHYVQEAGVFLDDARAAAESAPPELAPSWETAIDGLEHIRSGYADSITASTSREQDAAYQEVLRGQQLQATVFNDLDQQGCITGV